MHDWQFSALKIIAGITSLVCAWNLNFVRWYNFDSTCYRKGSPCFLFHFKGEKQKPQNQQMEPNALKVSRLHIRLYLQVSFQLKLKNASQLGVLFILCLFPEKDFILALMEHIWVTSIKTMKKMETNIMWISKKQTKKKVGIFSLEKKTWGKRWLFKIFERLPYVWWFRLYLCHHSSGQKNNQQFGATSRQVSKQCKEGF